MHEWVAARFSAASHCNPTAISESHQTPAMNPLIATGETKRETLKIGKRAHVANLTIMVAAQHRFNLSTTIPPLNSGMGHPQPPCYGSSRSKLIAGNSRTALKRDHQIHTGKPGFGCPVFLEVPSNSLFLGKSLICRPSHSIWAEGRGVRTPWEENQKAAHCP